MSYSKYSRKLKTRFTFYLFRDCIVVCIGDRRARRICIGGKLIGKMLHTTEDRFKRDCERWYRKHIKRAELV